MKAEAQEPGVLSAILAETLERMAARAPEVGEWERLAARAQPAPPFAPALRSGSAVAVIAEIKRRSPSSGTIREGANAIELARQYQSAGAAALSVLTEAQHFGGSLEDLMQVARSVRLPTLRKDFIVDPIQIYEAKAAGASAVLLIVRALTDEKLQSLAALARHIELATLVEVHAANELPRAIAAEPSVIGVNARDLETLVVDPARVAPVLAAVPPGIPAVAESGLKVRADVERAAADGADAVLVGTALAGSDDPGTALKELLGVPRKERAG